MKWIGGNRKEEGHLTQCLSRAGLTAYCSFPSLMFLGSVMFYLDFTLGYRWSDRNTKDMYCKRGVTEIERYKDSKRDRKCNVSSRF